MKITGILIIVFCLVCNVLVGMFLLGKSLTKEQLYVSKESKLISYDQYGIRMMIPKNMSSLGSRVDMNVLESFSYDDIADQFDPVLQINVYGQVQERSGLTSEEYKKISEKDFKDHTDPALQLQYQDGGIYTTTKGVKLYSDVVTLLSDGQLMTQKIVTLFHNGNQIQLFWSDESIGFITSVSRFNAIIETIEVY
jgi:uncharacterized protein YneF (UPF0154 family)